MQFLRESEVREIWFSHGNCFGSDHIALVKAFDGFQAAKREGRERSYCWDNFLSSNTLQMMEDMRRQFQDLLSDIGFVDKSRGFQVCKDI